MTTQQCSGIKPLLLSAAGVGCPCTSTAVASACTCSHALQRTTLASSLKGDQDQWMCTKAFVAKTHHLLLLWQLLLPLLPQQMLSGPLHKETYPLGCRKNKLKPGLWMATHSSSLEPVLVRPCSLCSTAASVMFLGLSCQPSSDITSCYMEVLLRPEGCCRQTRMGSSW